MYTAALTLFTRPNCSLCDVAKATLTTFRQHRTVSYTEIDIARSAHNDTWWEKYQYDVPVLHVERVEHTYVKKDVVSVVGVLMHRFGEGEVAGLVDLAEGREEKQKEEGLGG